MQLSELIPNSNRTQTEGGKYTSLGSGFSALHHDISPRALRNDMDRFEIDSKEGLRRGEAGRAGRLAGTVGAGQHQNRVVAAKAKGIAYHDI